MLCSSMLTVSEPSVEFLLISCSLSVSCEYDMGPY